MPKAPKQRLLKRRSFLWQVVWYLLGLSAVAVLTLSVMAFAIAKSHMEQVIFEQIAALVAAKEDVIETRLQQDRERATLLAAWEEVHHIARTGEGAEAMNTIFVQFLEEGVPVSGITVFNNEKNSMMSIGTPIETVPTMSAPSRLIPMATESGWSGHIAYALIRNDAGLQQGILAIQYDIGALLQNILSASVIGETAEVLLGRQEGEDLMLLHHRYKEEVGGLLYLGSLEEEYKAGALLAQAVLREEGMRRAEDYKGVDVFAAYRYLPTFEWGLVAKVDVHEALAGVFALRATLTIVSIVIIVLAGLLSVVLARRVTHPLRRLSNRMEKLGPGHWSYRRSVHSGDEIETLDRVAADLAKRLNVFYRDLEGQVRKRTKELGEQYQKDRTLLQSIQHGIVAVDAKGIVTDVNSSAAEIIGQKELGLIGKNINEVFPLLQHSRPVPPARHLVTRCLRRKKKIRMEPGVNWSVSQASGALIPINLSVSPILSGKKLIGAIAVFYDMTEERRVDYIKSEFITLASHQLRTPLSSLQWYIELFGSEGESKLSGVQEEYLREMDTASKRMAKLVDALLHAARLEGRDIKPNKQRINVTEFIQDMSEEFRSLAKASKISCEVKLPKKKHFLYTDPILLHIVFQNLFSNAVKYNKAGGTVKIEMEVVKNTCKIQITDSGVGIPKQAQKRIFERLYRADNVRQMDTDGNGLGLYISRMVMDNLGGAIDFKSHQNKGTTFTIKIPKTTRKTPKKKSSGSSQ
jgi:PAS domain S-box-containing protein